MKLQNPSKFTDHKLAKHPTKILTNSSNMQFNILLAVLATILGAVNSVCATPSPTKGMPFFTHDQQTNN